jgi:hypothetical protein
VDDHLVQVHKRRENVQVLTINATQTNETTDKEMEAKRRVRTMKSERFRQHGEFGSENKLYAGHYISDG